MITHKNMTKAVGVLMASAVMLCMLAMVFSPKIVEVVGSDVVSMQYEEELFDTDELIQIDIQMEQEEWEDMLDSASTKEYHACDIVINGHKIYNVGIRTKGNTSLSAIAMNPETERFSLKVEFDHYVEGQTCFGLDKLILNNNYADATNMKEAVVYDMYQYLGADASLYNYAQITVNGEYWGVYLALEAVEESFLLRNYGTEDEALYKPDSMKMGGGDKSGNGFPGGMPFGRGEFPDEDNSGKGLEAFEGDRPDSEDFEGGRPGSGEFEGGRTGSEDFEGDRPGSGDFAKGRPESGEFEVDRSGSGDFAKGRSGLEDFGKGRSGSEDFGEGHPDPGRFGMGGSGADLNYTDDDLDSYSDIWEGEVTDTGKQDHRRVVTALENISAGTNLEKYLDVDNILKYMAVHTFSVNMDSLSGNMAHNYYLYEHDGMLNILPWDYNLSFGGMNMGPDSSALEVVNDAIDSPFQMTEFFDALLENEDYFSRYHEYLQQLAEGYVLEGKFTEVCQRIRGQIDVLVETDPTALYSYEAYEAGVEMLCQTVMLRAESIKGQLEGVIPSTDEGQRANPENLVDASMIDIAVMGVFDMAGGSNHRIH